MRRSSEGVVEHSELAGPRRPWPRGWTPERVIDILEPFVRPERKERLRTVIAQRLDSVTVLMEAPHDPHNGAAVLRTCEAFGVSHLNIVPRDEVPLFARSVSKGTGRWVDIVIHQTASHAIQSLRARGYTLVASAADGQLLPEQLADVPRLALLVGNEHDGISRELARAADQTVRVPMRGFVESLNVSVASAILLAAAVKYRPGDLPTAEQTLLYARGLYHSLSHAEQILNAHAAQR